jgi:RimJ/RimL family protein N-acetyltransferase
MFTGKIIIKETDEKDLMNIMNLWNNGKVMNYVGFPNGLGYNQEKIENWYKNIIQTKWFKHYSIYTEKFGYCGETGYGIDNIENENVGLEIKLLPEAQGKGIAEYSIRYVIEHIDKEKIGKSVWVDPHKENEKAINLYKKLGFKENKFPEYLSSEDDGKYVYMELLLKEYKQ